MDVVAAGVVLLVGVLVGAAACWLVLAARHRAAAAEFKTGSPMPYVLTGLTTAEAADYLRLKDRKLYEHTKRELASRPWEFTQNYADAKSAVVEEIIGRMLGL